MMDARQTIIRMLEQQTGLDGAILESYLEVPPSAEMGDFALPCFRLARTLRKAPPAIAEELAAGIGTALDPEGPLDRVAAVGGYLNFFIDRPHYTAGTVRGWLETGRIPGTDASLRSKTVLLEYSSPNIAKPFHVGHAFTTILGHSLARIYEHLGYTVVRLNHLGDYGTQFGKLIAAYLHWGDEAALERDPIGELSRIYVKFHQEEEKNPDLTEEGRRHFRRLEAGEAEEKKLWEHFRELSLREFSRLYRRLNVSFDDYSGESFYSDRIPAVVDMLRDRGLLEESQGAMVVRLDDRNLPPCIVLKSDGATIYATRDLAAVLYRWEKYRFHRNIYVVGLPQTLHFQQVFSVLDKAGYDCAEDCVHVGFGTIRFADAVFSSRKGNAPLLEDLLNASVAKTREIISRNAADRGTGMDDTEISELAERIGVGSVLFSYLRNGRERDMVFSLEDMLDFEGDTAPYLLYTYARIQSILRRADTDPAAVTGEDLTALTLPEEYEIARQINALPGAIEHAASDHEPFYVSRQLLSLVRAFNKFYNQHSVLSAGDPALVRARLALCDVVARCLKQGLYLLGIDTVDRM